MSLEDFQLTDNETVGNSIIKKRFLKIYHQQWAMLDNSDHNIEIIFGENIYYHQIGNAYLQYEITVRKDAADRILIVGDAFRLVNNASAYCFKEANFSTTGGGDIEHNKYVGQVPTSMRILTSKDGDLISQFDKIDEFKAQIGNTSLKRLINNPDIAGNERKIKGQLPLERIFGFLKRLKNLLNYYYFI